MLYESGFFSSFANFGIHIVGVQVPPKILHFAPPQSLSATRSVYRFHAAQRTPRLDYPNGSRGKTMFASELESHFDDTDQSKKYHVRKFVI